MIAEVSHGTRYTRIITTMGLYNGEGVHGMRQACTFYLLQDGDGLSHPQFYIDRPPNQGPV